MGIRLALGATRDDLVRQVVLYGLRLTLGGLFVGLLGTALLGRTLASLLYDAGASAAPTVAVTAVVLLGVAVLAALVPALRAGRVDPMLTLRG